MSYDPIEILDEVRVRPRVDDWEIVWRTVIVERATTGAARQHGRTRSVCPRTVERASEALRLILTGDSTDFDAVRRLFEPVSPIEEPARPPQVEKDLPAIMSAGNYRKCAVCGAQEMPIQQVKVGEVSLAFCCRDHKVLHLDQLGLVEVRGKWTKP